MQKPLDYKAKVLITAIEAAGDPAIFDIPVELARVQVEGGYARLKTPVKQVGSIRNILIPGKDNSIPVRVYIPEGEGPFPMMIFFHGGGWVFFNLDAYDPICTHLCSSSRCLLVSVDYRLSPEYKFPAALDDCFTATNWVYKHAKELNGDGNSIFIAGDSAGGNLATVTAIRIRDNGGPPILGQILIYPVTDYFDPGKKSYSEFAEGYSLTKEAMRWFWDQYLGTMEDAKNPYVAPLLISDLSGLPPALVIVSGYDPLRDEGLAYAKRMKEDGVDVELSFYEEMIHGFLSYLGLFPQANVVVGEISRWIIKRLN